MFDFCWPPGQGFESPWGRHITQRYDREVGKRQLPFFCDSGSPGPPKGPLGDEERSGYQLIASDQQVELGGRCIIRNNQLLCNQEETT